MITALLLDPFTKSAQEVEMEDGLEAKHEMLGCDILDLLYITPDLQLALWVDDDGRLKANQRCFYLGGHLIAGKALLMAYQNPGEDEEEARNLTMDEMRMVVDMIVSCPDDYDYTPPAPIIIRFD